MRTRPSCPSAMSVRSTMQCQSLTACKLGEAVRRGPTQCRMCFWFTFQCVSCAVHGGFRLPRCVVGSTAHGSMTLVSTTAERTPSNGSACTHVSNDAAHSYGLKILVSQQHQRPWLIRRRRPGNYLPARPWTSEPLQLTWTYSVKARRMP